MVRRCAVLGGLTKKLSLTGCQQFMAPLHPPQLSFLPPMYNNIAADPRPPFDCCNRRQQRNLLKSQSERANFSNSLWGSSSEQVLSISATSDVSQHLKKQMKRQQQLPEMHKRMPQHWPKQRHHHLKSSFKPFNFGKCANSLITFKNEAVTASEFEETHRSATPQSAAPHFGITGKQIHKSLQQHINDADFNYVKLAKQMSVGNEELSNQVASNTEEQVDQRTLESAKRVLNSLAADIEGNLQKIHKMLDKELPRAAINDRSNGHGNLKSLAALPKYASNMQTYACQQQQQQQCSPNCFQCPATLAANLNFAQEMKANSFRQHQHKLQQQKSSPQNEEQEPTLTPEQFAHLQNILDQQERESILKNRDQQQRESKAKQTNGQNSSRTHKQQLNLSKLLRDKKLQGSEVNLLWNSLTQLVTQVNKSDKPMDDERLRAGSGKVRNPKQYSIYLMVTSDEEDEAERPIEYSRKNVPQEQQQQQLKKRIRKRKRLPHTELPSSISMAERRPLHWPKYVRIESKDQSKKTKSRPSSRKRSQRYTSLDRGAWLTQPAMLNGLKRGQNLLSPRKQPSETNYAPWNPNYMYT